MSEIRTERNNSELKILTKIIKDKDYNIISENNLTKNDFKDYCNRCPMAKYEIFCKPCKENKR